MKKILILFLLTFCITSYSYGQTVITKTIKSSLGDYTTLSLFESSEQADLTGVNQIKQAECYSFADTTQCVFNGWVTDATRYIRIYTPASERHDGKWNTNKYRLTGDPSGATTGMLALLDNHIRVEGLQIENTRNVGSSDTNVLYVATDATSDIRISNSILRSTSSTAGVNQGIRINHSTAVVKIWNTIIYNNNENGIDIDAAVSVDIFNCTVYNNPTVNISRSAGTVTVKNTVSFNSADDFSGTFSAIDYCASDDNDGTNNVAETGGGAGWTGDFVGAASGDFHLLVGSGLVGTGTDNPGSGLYSDDIDSQARTSTWDVGADEYIAPPSPGGFVPKISISKNEQNKTKYIYNIGSIFGSYTPVW